MNIMKLKYLFTSLLACALLFVGCTEEYKTSSLKELQLSQTFVSIPLSGGTVAIDLNATDNWAFVLSDASPLPSWLTVSQLSGTPGSIKLSFSAPSTQAGRETTLTISVGDKIQNIIVRQGEVTASQATCAEVIAGPDGKSYIVKGVCTSIANTTYGNWYLDDGTGSIYIYGTVDATGSYNWSKIGIEAGDVVTVKGPKTTYGSTVELVDVKVVSITKSLIKAVNENISVGNKGGEAIAKFIVKGTEIGVTIPDEYKSWIGVTSIKKVKAIDSDNPDTTVVALQIAENPGGGRKGEVSFSSASGKNSSTVAVTINQEGNIVELTVADFLAREVSANALYKISGKVKQVVNATYGNFYLEDYTGYVYVYGLTATPQAKNDKSFASLDIKEGDQVTLIGTRAAYLGSKVADQVDQVGLAYHVSHSQEISVSAFLAAPVSTDKWYRLTGSVKEIKSDVYGNFYLEDGTGYVYIYGLTSTYAYNFSTKKHVNDKKFADLGLAAGDEISICCQRGQYAGAKVEDQKEEGLMGFFAGKK